MKTTIDNTHRIFIIDSGLNTYACNLQDIPNVLSQFNQFSRDKCIISEIWNGKLKRCSKKHLNEMFEVNQTDFKIK